MNTSQFKISIEKPCTQNWDAMNPNKIGRFCSSCSKSVVDFTGQTDLQVKNYLIEHKGQEVCGRLTNLQLNRIVITFDQSLLYSTIPFWQKFLMIVLVCFGSDLLGYDFCFSQELNEDSLEIQNAQFDSIAKVQADTLVVNGQEPKIDTPFIQIPERIDVQLNLNCPTMGSVMMIPHTITMVQTLGMISINPIEEPIENQKPFLETTEPLIQVVEDKKIEPSETAIKPFDKTKPSSPFKKEFIPPIEAVLTNEEAIKKNTNKS